MDNFIEQFSDLLAEYDIDVYNTSLIGEDKYRLDIIIVDDNMSEIRARLRLQTAAKKINFLWATQNVSLSIDGFKLNEKTDEEYDASIIIKLHKTSEQKAKEAREIPEDEAPFTEEKFTDSVKTRDDIFDLGNIVKITDDETGEDITNFNKVYYNLKTKKVVGPNGAFEVLKRDPSIKFVDGLFTDEWTSIKDNYTVEDVKDDLKLGWFDLGRDWVAYDPEDLVMHYIEEHRENFENITDSKKKIKDSIAWDLVGFDWDYYNIDETPAGDIGNLYHYFGVTFEDGSVEIDYGTGDLAQYIKTYDAGPIIDFYTTEDISGRDDIIMAIMPNGSSAATSKQHLLDHPEDWGDIGITSKEDIDNIKKPGFKRGHFKYLYGNYTDIMTLILEAYLNGTVFNSWLEDYFDFY